MRHLFTIALIAMIAPAASAFVSLSGVDQLETGQLYEADMPIPLYEWPNQSEARGTLPQSVIFRVLMATRKDDVRWCQVEADGNAAITSQASWIRDVDAVGARRVKKKEIERDRSSGYAPVHIPLKWEVVKEMVGPADIKWTTIVRLNQRLNKEAIPELAEEVKGRMGEERTFISFVLAGWADPDRGWAVVSYEGNQQVRVNLIGLSANQAHELMRLPLPEGEIIGRWVDDDTYLSLVTIVCHSRGANHYEFLRQFPSDMSGGVISEPWRVIVKAKADPHGTRFDPRLKKDKDKWGEGGHLVVRPNGNLEWRNLEWRDVPAADDWRPNGTWHVAAPADAVPNYVPPKSAPETTGPAFSIELRQKIFREIVLAERQAKNTTDGMVEGRRESVRKWKEVRLKESIQLRHKLTRKQMMDIAVEGVGNRWPVP